MSRITENNPYRGAALITAAVFGILALYLGASIASALFSFKVPVPGPGVFFTASYGVLALGIPVYLLIAVFILADPVYRPGRIFALTGTIVPFLTLAVGITIFRDYDRLAEASLFLRAIGKIGLGALISAAAALEGILLSTLTRAIFPPEKVRRGPAIPTKFMGARNPQQGNAPTRYLPPPRSDDAGAQPQQPSAFALPDLKPLGSAAAFKAMQSERAVQAAELAIKPSTELAAVPPVFEEVPLEEFEPLPPVVAWVGGSALPSTTPSALPGQIVTDGSPGPVPRSGGLRVEPQRGEAEAEPTRDKSRESPIPSAVDTIMPGVDPDLERALSDAEREAAEISAEKHRAAEIHSSASPALDPEPPRRRKSNEPYRVPVEGILTAYPDGEYWIIDQATRDSAVILKETLKEFNIQAEVTGIRKGPVITMFEILPAPGVKLSKIVNLQDNIALRLAASSVRIVAPIPGKHAVGIEVPNRKRNIVSFKEMIEGELHREGKKPEIPVVLGKDIAGEAQTLDLVATPHLLIAGATGSGKSVCVNSMILSILYQRSPAEVRLILIDPKIVELKLYNDIPHLLTPVITEPKRAFQALQYCIYEMERRYALLDSMGVRDIRSYNRRIKERNIATERIPYIVVVIDEFADLMATTGKELESTVARLAAMSRAVGIHLVLATQRPSIDVITGLIKANIPSRIAFMVAGKMDSRIIIDMVGAEKLLGKGDMLYAGVTDPFPIRMQGAFVSEEEVERVVEFVKTLGEPDYLDEEIFYDEDEEEAVPSLFSDGEDPLFEKALEIVHQQGKASASYIQRRLKIGYNRAARLVEEMEERGIVGPAQGSKPRELLRGS